MYIINIFDIVWTMVRWMKPWKLQSMGHKCVWSKTEYYMWVKDTVESWPSLWWPGQNV